MIRDTIACFTIFAMFWAVLTTTAALEPCPKGEACYWLEGTSFQRASDLLDP